MTVALGAEVSARGIRVAAICRSGTLRVGKGILGEKRPLAFLVGGADGISAFRLSGAAMTLDEAERLCPGCVARFAETGASEP